MRQRISLGKCSSRLSQRKQKAKLKFIKEKLIKLIEESRIKVSIVPIVTDNKKLDENKWDRYFWAKNETVLIWLIKKEGEKKKNDKKHSAAGSIIKETDNMCFRNWIDVKEIIEKNNGKSQQAFASYRAADYLGKIMSWNHFFVKMMICEVKSFYFGSVEPASGSLCLSVVSIP